MTAAAFELPSALEAHEPPEARGLARDAVRLMVASRATGEIAHRRFHELPDVLAPGDVLVVNTSATLPAAVDAHRSGGAAVQVRFATAAPHLPRAWWVIEVRAAGGATPLRGLQVGEQLALPDGGRAELVARYAAGSRLWLARIDLGAGVGTIAEPGLPAYLARHGTPIRYAYVPEKWPLSDYQTAFATHPGSAEMPSAGRPFTPELVTRLVARGVLFAPVTLHAGVSSPERHEPPYPEAYAVGPATARLVNAARAWGGRIVAVGTTAVRALETVAAPEGTLTAGRGWTGLVIGSRAMPNASPSRSSGRGPERGLRAIDGLITGWHEPQASHLQLLEAVAGRRLLDACYGAALDLGYLWHEFGDSHLVLP